MTAYVSLQYPLTKNVDKKTVLADVEKKKLIEEYMEGGGSEVTQGKGVWGGVKVQ